MYEEIGSTDLDGRSRRELVIVLDNPPVAPPTQTAAGMRGRWTWLVGRGFGALAVLVVGVVHLQQYLGPYAAIPTIGMLFVVNFVAAAMIGLALLAPIEHLAGRWAGVAVAFVTVSGIVLAAVSFVLLLVSEHMPLFGFQEPGYDPTAIAVSRWAEVAAVFFLGASLAGRFAGTVPKYRW